MISVSDISVFFGEQLLFKDVSFMVRPNDRIGLVGRNGAGKSTLLNVLKGLHKPNSGNVSMPRSTRIGYLPQELKINPTRTVFEEARTAFMEIMEVEDKLIELKNSKQEEASVSQIEALEHRLELLGQANVNEEMEKVLRGLGFEEEELSQPVAELSGGWQMRVELAKILLSRPDLLLLDEPTNHLDIESISWLEDFLISFAGAVILVTHDKAFLDNICLRTMEVTMGTIEDYKAPYSKYLQMRKQRREQQLSSQKNQQRNIKQMETAGY